MRTQTRTKTKATPQEVVELKNLLPVLARLVEDGKISIRLGPVPDVKDWLNNYQAFEKSPVVTIDAVSVRLEGVELQVDCELDEIPKFLRTSPMSLLRPTCMSMPGRDRITSAGGLAAIHVARIKTAALADKEKKSNGGRE
jgi:hypothetical protein